jgi:hypothetical protein
MSSESVSTISTNNSPSSPRPARQRSMSPRREEAPLSRSVSPAIPSGSRRSFNSVSKSERSPQRPETRRSNRSYSRQSRERSRSRDSRSPPRGHERDYRSRVVELPDRDIPRRRRYSSAENSDGESFPSKSPPRRSPPRDSTVERSRDQRQPPRDRGRRGFNTRGRRDFHVGDRQVSEERPPPRRSPPRERSLSPFSKRLALTQAMNMGR